MDKGIIINKDGASQEQPQKSEEKQEKKLRKLMEIWIDPEGNVYPKGPIHNKILCLDALATAMKIVIAVRPRKVITPAEAVRRIGRKVKGAFGKKG